MHQPYSLHWFRRDLRIAGNPALQSAWKKTKGKVLGIFCFDSQFLSRSDFSHNRFGFFLNTLEALKEEFREQGGDLLVVDAPPEKAFARIFENLKSLKLPYPAEITWNRDYEPYARQRDQQIQDLCKKWGIQSATFRDHLILEPHEVLKEPHKNTWYQVYSPFWRRWHETIHRQDFSVRITSQNKALSYFEKKSQEGKTENLFSLSWKQLFGETPPPFCDSFDAFKVRNAKQVSIPLPPAGSKNAFLRLKEFKDLLPSYEKDRDIPSIAGTSRFSIYFKNGSLTTSQVAAAYNLLGATVDSKDAKTKFLKEIVWREFYYSILFHKPEVEQNAFLPQYENLKWENNEEWFQRWCEGTTGFPIVDAGMRELNTTGFMHNRVRMIVASFLTKDLLIDWKWGEKYFMNKLLDGDLAPNNGGWQWAASTGCDPQPYFRIFNPWLQSSKFDPNGDYIKKYVPELKDIKPKMLHTPDIQGVTKNYPLPIVDHSAQRAKALILYQSSRS